MDDLIPARVAPARPGAAARMTQPLLGVTLLLVEDSRFSSEAVRLLCLRSGARIRRADCLRSARRHLAIYRPEVALIDLGLPDGSGLELIGEMARMVPPVSVILATSGDEGLKAAALHSGASGFLDKPLGSLAAFQQAILSHLPPEARPLGPRALPEGRVEPDIHAYHEDLAHVAHLMAHGVPRELGYAIQFLESVAGSAGDLVLAGAAAEFAAILARGEPAEDRALALRSEIDLRLRLREVV